jgi:hypothetical protein
VGGSYSSRVPVAAFVRTRPTPTAASATPQPGAALWAGLSSPALPCGMSGFRRPARIARRYSRRVR